MKFIYQKTICSCRVISIFMKFDKSSQQAETSGVWSVYNLEPESSSSKQFPSVCLVCGVGCGVSLQCRGTDCKTITRPQSAGSGCSILKLTIFREFPEISTENTEMVHNVNFHVLKSFYNLSVTSLLA